ncbi:unnamed protein product [Mytilus edulis]|uniref:Uncharacterized protein n=1 Tax=Mytilus edulis TaxID=6550 RepID=A0A8S3RXQ7_MYTED|nr:unnamed protein product [Mytilus edulis]
MVVGFVLHALTVWLSYKGCEDLEEEEEEGKYISFVSVHRFGKQRQNIQKIMTKFVSLKDKQLVKRNCHKLKGANISVRACTIFGKNFKEKEKLYPVLKHVKKDRKKAVLLRDKLFIEGKLYEPSDDREPKHTDNKENRNRNTQKQIVYMITVHSLTHGIVRYQNYGKF